MEEEFCSDGQLLVAVNDSGNICGIQRLGSSAVKPVLVAQMLEVLYIDQRLNEMNNIEHTCMNTPPPPIIEMPIDCLPELLGLSPGHGQN